MPKSIFISIGWSIVLKSALLAITFFALCFFILTKHLQSQALQIVKLTSQRDYKQFEQLLQSNRQFHLGFIEAVSATLNSQTTTNSLDPIEAIKYNWNKFQLIFGIEKALIYSDKNSVAYDLGDNSITIPSELLQTTTTNSEPFESFFCEDRCYLFMGIPFLDSDNKPTFIILVTGIDYLIETYNTLTGSTSGLAHFRKDIGLTLTGKYKNNKALNKYISEFNNLNAWETPDETTIYKGHKIEFQSLSFKKISNNTNQQDVYLFWSLDVTDSILQFAETLRNSMIIIAVLSISMILFIFLMLRNLTIRSQNLAETLPLLTQAKYKEAEQRLKPPKSFLPFEDDIDRLFDTSLTVTQQLQRMNEEIDLQNQRLHKMAYRDSLTGLPNRQSFYESLNQQLRLLSRRDKFLGLLFIDVDGFKPVNDTYGHKAGDFILTTLAVRVNNCIRQADTLFRLAGDEFVIIVSELEAEDGLHIIARKVVDSMHRPTSWEGHILDVSLSVGGVMTKNSDLHQDEFLHKADEAMYISKNTGKGKYTFLGIL
jgi:diguanylate cyclase (GGDEF)-like protein